MTVYFIHTINPARLHPLEIKATERIIVYRAGEQSSPSAEVAVKNVKLTVLIALTLLLGACTTTQLPERQFRESLPYMVEVRPVGHATVSGDGFVTRFEFEVIAPQPLNRNSLVQELNQTTTYYLENGNSRERTMSLVEAFRLRLAHVDAMGNHYYRIDLGQNDRHAMHGLQDLPEKVISVEIDREVFAYVANVGGAEFTPLGFAQLPQNEDGSVVSRVPDSFNEDYQRAYDTRGWVAESGDALGLTYRLHYRLIRENGRADARFIVDHSDGHGIVHPPAVVVAE